MTSQNLKLLIGTCTAPPKTGMAALLALVLVSHAIAQSDPSAAPSAAPSDGRVHAPHPCGPDASNPIPPTGVAWTPPTPNHAVRTKGFPMGADHAGECPPAHSAPPLLHSGGHHSQHGYSYPLDLSFHNLQPGRTVCVPAATWWVTRYEGRPLAETRRRVDPASASMPAVAVAPPVPVAPPVDDGREAMRARDYERAIAIYERRHEEQRGLEQAMKAGAIADRTALRLLAVALVGAGRLEEASGKLTKAQAEDASLALHAIDGRDAIGSPRELRRLVVASVKFAKAKPSPESWELVAVLMEAEGRDEVAAKMRERGSGAGAATRAPEQQPRGPASFRMPASEER